MGGKSKSAYHSLGKVLLNRLGTSLVVVKYTYVGTQGIENIGVGFNKKNTKTMYIAPSDGR